MERANLYIGLTLALIIASVLWATTLSIDAMRICEQQHSHDVCVETLK